MLLQETLYSKGGVGAEWIPAFAGMRGGAGAGCLAGGVGPRLRGGFGGVAGHAGGAAWGLTGGAWRASAGGARVGGGVVGVEWRMGEDDMELYQLDYVLHAPSQEQGGLYMAEIPDLPGCRAWAETAKETLAELGTVAEQFILSYKDRGKPLPEAIAPAVGSGSESLDSSLRSE